MDAHTAAKGSPKPLVVPSAVVSWVARAGEGDGGGRGRVSEVDLFAEDPGRGGRDDEGERLPRKPLKVRAQRLPGGIETACGGGDAGDGEHECGQQVVALPQQDLQRRHLIRVRCSGTGWGGSWAKVYGEKPGGSRRRRAASSTPSAFTSQPPVG